MLDNHNLSRERRAFIGRLGTEPAFFLQHARGLSLAVLRKIHSKLVATLSRKHKGRKVRPRWLDGHAISGISVQAGTPDALTLPVYPRALPTVSILTFRREDPRGADGDPEEYLAEQRWGFLLESLLGQAVDWRGGVNECARWIENHTSKADPAWEPYSACERVANLLIFLSVMPSIVRGVESLRNIRLFLADSIQWICAHLEYYGASQTNNHILNNARALVLAGVATDNNATVQKGMMIFRNCLPALIMKGGFLRERSSHYQLVVLNWVLDAWRFIAASEGLGSNNGEFLKAYMERMLNAASLLCDSHGTLLSLIGDVSPDASPEQSARRLAVLYPDVWPPSSRSQLPLEVKDGWFRISNDAATILGNFPAGQYPADFPTHGHCDFASFVWLHGGQEILGECGRYRYTSDAISQFQKSASGHNVPLVDGFAPLCESLLANGFWWPRPYADATLEAIEDGRELVLAHDGFARSTLVKRHSRRISLQEAGLVVVDRFEGQGHIDVSFCWHFGDGFEVFDEASMVARGSAGQVRLDVSGVGGPPSMRPICEGSTGSWRSRAYGHRHSVLGICLSWRVVLPVTISTRFILSLVEGQQTHSTESG